MMKDFLKVDVQYPQKICELHSDIFTRKKET